jgi:phenylacetate-coenzyme A ligase PaaK-like adenylate-forming protein
MSERKFFNEEMETLPKSKLKALQLERLQAIVERAYAQNQFYRNLYDEAGVKPSDIKSLEDMRKLPFLEKNGTCCLSLWDGICETGRARWSLGGACNERHNG